MRSWKHVLGIAGIALALGMAGAGREPVVAGCLQRQTPINIAMFHGDRARLGWNAAETELSPAHVSGPAFGPIWSSPPLDSVTLDGLTGASKATADSAISVPPGLVRLRVVTPTGAPAYLAVDGREMRTTLVNPGSPVVTSNGGRDAIVWVLDPSQPRTAPLVGPEGSVARPVLHAFDAFTLERLWRSGPDDLEVGGKYSSPAVGRGMVIVGTDRIQAFGLRASR